MANFESNIPFNEIHTKISSKQKNELASILNCHGNSFHTAYHTLMHCIKQCSEYYSLLYLTCCSSEDISTNNFIDAYFLMSTPCYKPNRKTYMYFPTYTLKDWELFFHFLEINLSAIFSKVKIELIENYSEYIPNTFSIRIIGYL